MTEETKGAEQETDEAGTSGASDPGGEESASSGGPQDDRKTRREKMGDGIRQGIGVLSAFREALEETIQEARERGDISADKAREAMKEALDRAQAAGEKARERLDFVSQAEFDSLRARVARLEESVFGVVSEPEPEPETADASEPPEASSPSDPPDDT